MLSIRTYEAELSNRRRLLLKFIEKAKNYSPGPRRPKRDYLKQSIDEGYEIPDYISDYLENKNVNLELRERLTKSNYVQRFHRLLWLEEGHRNIELQDLELDNQKIYKVDIYYKLIYPHHLWSSLVDLVSEGDLLFLSPKEANFHYMGLICELRKGNEIMFMVNRKGTPIENYEFTVNFLPSKIPFMRCHLGVDNFERSPTLKNMVFLPRHRKPKKYLIKSQYINSKLNTSQQQAIVNILRASFRPSPYIIFGPPGTGKTTTVVEAILQVFQMKKDSKILICSNSNSCVDSIADRLRKQRINGERIVKDEHIKRVISLERYKKSMFLEDIKDITVIMEHFGFSYILFDRLRICLTSCNFAANLYPYNVKFDYLFIDEAAQANEPESLIPMGLFKPEQGCVVLSGDHQQLGPIVFSKVASRGGLATSLMERLMFRSYAYQRMENGNYNEQYVTKLIDSYRSDPRLVEINNMSFYQNDLKFHGKTPQHWLDKFKSKHPLIYFPIHGYERRHPGSTSTFNLAEVNQVVELVKFLYTKGLQSNQLGIITPYRGQVIEIEREAKKKELELCTIGTVEKFQGEERHIVIISTVKSNPRANLEFLFQRKRFNVATSRAKWLTILVGHPDVLGSNIQSNYWAKFLEVAHKLDQLP